MTREEQDKRWNSHTKEEQERIIANYNDWKTTNLFEKDFVDRAIKLFENEYGSHNLNPKPNVIYEDVKVILFGKQAAPYITKRDCCTKEMTAKVEAITMLLNVAKFLNKNEDGSDWVPNWKNEQEEKWHISIRRDKILISYILWDNACFVYFRTYELAQQAIQILGEETIRLALSTDY